MDQWNLWDILNMLQWYLLIKNQTTMNQFYLQIRQYMDQYDAGDDTISDVTLIAQLDLNIAQAYSDVLVTSSKPVSGWDTQITELYNANSQYWWCIKDKWFQLISNKDADFWRNQKVIRPFGETRSNHVSIVNLKVIILEPVAIRHRR